jgi:hypothetical protein
MTNIPADIRENLRSPISNTLKRYILDKAWNTKLTAAEFSRISERYDAYFCHYQTVCRNCSSDDVGCLTHEYLLEALEYVKIKTFNECQAELTSFLAKLNDPYLNARDTKSFVTRWILQAGKALLLLDLCEWKGTDTLKTFLAKDTFVPSVQDDKYRLPVSFNLRNLQDIAGLKIRWTGLICEHLSLEKEDTQLAVFHQSSIMDAFGSR